MPEKLVNLGKTECELFHFYMHSKKIIGTEQRFGVGLVV